MTDETTKTEEISEVKKSDPVIKTDDPSALQILADIVKRQDEKIDNFDKKFEDLSTLIKEQNANPVDSGVEAENKPKTEDADDVGDKVTIGNEVAPKPSDSQASIIAPALETSGSDKEGLKMETKAEDSEDKKDEDKKEEVAKTDESEDKKEDAKTEDVKKSDELYEIVKTVRPKIYIADQVSSVPTGYQILKAVANGFGVTSSAEEALTMMYNKEANGEFGNGQPQGVY